MHKRFLFNQYSTCALQSKNKRVGGWRRARGRKIFIFYFIYIALLVLLTMLKVNKICLFYLMNNFFLYAILNWKVPIEVEYWHKYETMFILDKICAFFWDIFGQAFEMAVWHLWWPPLYQISSKMINRFHTLVTSPPILLKNWNSTSTSFTKYCIIIFQLISKLKYHLHQQFLFQIYKQ